MIFFEQAILETELEDWNRSLEQLRVEVFVVDQEIHKLTVFELG